MRRYFAVFATTTMNHLCGRSSDEISVKPAWTTLPRDTRLNALSEYDTWGVRCD
jgi:hypothetical protein